MEDETRADHTETDILYIRQGDQKDGYAEVRVQTDKAAAYATLYPPTPGGAFLTWGTVSQRIADFGIIRGVLEDNIQEAIFKANSTHQPVKDVLIARGEDPVTEIPEHFVIRKDLLERKPEIDPDLARVDWHSISAFSIVNAKDPIARRIPKVDGKNGWNIFGEERNFPVKNMSAFSAGGGVIDHPQGLFAGKSGRLSIDSSGSISIEEVLVLKKGVDFSTGNITFPGDVILQGKVADGFKIYTGGSLIAADVVDVTEVVTRKDFIVQGGIEGKSTGAARVGRNLKAKYIQNCRVAVRGDIEVSGSIVQSKVFAMGSIRMGDAGKIIGCECIAIGSVSALDIGNPRGARTWIRCGTDFTVQQELDIANEQLKVIAVKLQKAEEIYRDEPLEDIKKYIDELKARKSDIINRIPTYLPRIDKNDEAAVIVKGTAYPGAEIEICHVPYKVTKAVKQTVFKLDKLRGTIVTEPYKKS